MAQRQWTVPGFGGRNYRIGLYHGERSGHVVVYCNNRIIIIDFGVQDTKDYSFFLDQELYELFLDKKGDQFVYELRHNEDVDTPHNQRREQDDKQNKQRLQLFAAVVTIIFLIFGGFWLKRYINRPRPLERLEALAQGAGVDTEVVLYRQDDRWLANYRHEGQVKRIVLPPQDTITPFGFPYREGDRFPARYAPEATSAIWINFAEPGRRQLESYWLITLARHAELHPELTQAQVRCQLQLASELEGLTGLAKFFQQQTPSMQNAYLRLIRSQDFRQRVADCL